MANYVCMCQHFILNKNLTQTSWQTKENVGNAKKTYFKYKIFFELITELFAIFFIFFIFSHYRCFVDLNFKSEKTLI